MKRDNSTEQQICEDCVQMKDEVRSRNGLNGYMAELTVQPYNHSTILIL